MPIDQTTIPNLLESLSGFASGNTVGDQFANVNNILAGQNANAAKTAEQQALENQTFQYLQQRAPELAQAVQNKMIEPRDAFGMYLKQQQEAAAAAKPTFQKFDDGSYGWINPNTKSVDIVGKAAKPATPQFQKFDDGSYGFVDPANKTVDITGKVEKTQSQTELVRNLEAAGYKQGTPEFQQALLSAMKKPGMIIEQGPDGFRMVQGDVANAPKKLTESQSKDINWLNRGTGANEELNKIDEALTSLSETTAGALGTPGNYLKSEEYQLAERAGREFLAVLLRKDTGAAITNQEMAEYGRTFIPQPGDGPQVITAKRMARERFLDAMKLGLGGLAEDSKPVVAPKATDTTLPVGQKLNTTINNKPVTIERLD